MSNQIRKFPLPSLPLYSLPLYSLSPNPMGGECTIQESSLAPIQPLPSRSLLQATSPEAELRYRGLLLQLFLMCVLEITFHASNPAASSGTNTSHEVLSVDSSPYFSVLPSPPSPQHEPFIHHVLSFIRHLCFFWHLGWSRGHRCPGL